MERRLIERLYRDDRPARLGAEREQIPPLAKIARMPETMRGFGHVKEKNIKKAAAERARLEGDLENSRFAAAAE